jgi:hypothetical protein
VFSPEGSEAQVRERSGVNGKREEEEKKKNGTQRRCRHRSFDERLLLDLCVSLCNPPSPTTSCLPPPSEEPDSNFINLKGERKTNPTT